jgi:phospholipid transport system substrate-binding protein
LEILRRGLKVPIKVKMIKADTSWKVYDLVFLGISGVSNYRAQFRALLNKQSPAQVIAGIREKMVRQGVTRRN